MMKARNQGVLAAAISALFLGLSPIFGKQSILVGFSPFAVVAIRTTLATLLLLVFLLIFKKKYFTIYLLGLIGCLVAGFINGVGSIFYYSALARIDAGVGQLIYSFYPLLMVFWLILDRQSISKITILRLLLVIPGVFLLLRTSDGRVDFIGALFMFIAAALYSLHMLINQRVLYEVPAPTVTFYTLVMMTFTVSAAFLIFNPILPPSGTPWWPLYLLSLITFLSRLTLFLGIKHIGGLQTAILGLGELLITVLFSQIFLSERLVLTQWLGALFIFASLFLLVFDSPTRVKRNGKGFLYWLNPPVVNPTDYPFLK